MPMTEKEFKEHLMLYGATLESWSEDIRADAIRATYEPRISALVQEQRDFEQMLRSADAVEPASPWLANRIINAAGTRISHANMTAWLQELLASMLPQPAFALATVLTLGVVIGFILPTANGQSNVAPTYLEDDGTVL